MTEFVNYPVVKSSRSLQYFTPPAPAPPGTACLLAGIGFAYVSYPSADTPSAMAAVAANSVGIAFLGSIIFDISKGGLRNLLRTDLLCIVGLYGLTLAEFLFPQEGFFNESTTLQTNALALNIVLLGIAGLAIGRHLVAPEPMRSSWLQMDDISSTTIFNIVICSAFIGHLYMLLAVQFNLVAIIDAMLGPRFSEPWARSALGGWKTLINELALLTYIIPPLTGVIVNRRHSFPWWKLVIVLMCCGFIFFQSFASGTRNVFIAHMATMLMGYLITLPRNNFRNTVLPILAAILIAGYGSYHMLEFRTMGLRNYIENRAWKSETVRDTLAVDYNLLSIGILASSMPQNHNFLGLEILTWSIFKPVPRALWPSKPVGLSVSIEEIAGAEGYTLAATYLGESYMMAGMFGVVGMSLFFGALAAWWNRMAMRAQSDYALVVYALGFFAAGITMRSMFWTTTAILPVIALIVFRKYGPVR